MTGVAVLASTAPDPDLLSRGLAALGRDAAGEPRVVATVADSRPEWQLATIRSVRLQAPHAPTRNAAGAVAFHGQIQNRRELRQQLSKCPDIVADTDDGALLAALIQECGWAILRQIRGAFQAIVVDERDNRVCLINDKLGSFPLYWAADTSRLIAAPSVRAVVATLGDALALDDQAVADYVHFGLVLGNRTLARGVQLVPPGSTVSWSLVTGDVYTAAYWRLEEAFTEWRGDRTEYLESVRGAFNAAVEHSVDESAGIGMSLSGGLDSRAVLSALTVLGRPVGTYTLGIPGCADAVIADQLSTIAGTTHRFFGVDDQYLGAFLPNLERMVELTDGLYLSHGLTEMLALGALEQLDIRVLLRGHCGELAKTSLAWPFQTDAHVYALSTREEFVSYLAGRANYVSRAVAPSDLFAPGLGDLGGAAIESLRSSVPNAGLTPAQLCAYVYVNAHQRRFTVPSLELFRTRVSVGLPFADTAFLEVLLRGPAEWRDGTDIHKFIIGRNDPRLLAVRNSNTGASAGAGPFVESVMDKLNVLLKRLNVPGYRHYHRLDRWMHQELLASVETVLLDPATLVRGIFREPTVRRLVAETRDGRADHAHLLEVMLHIELWQRQNA
jgi:asparagine synthase (glutamine-hydrolysing)